MKHLYLVRHAKSSWAQLDTPDFDRPLNKRGKADAPIMGRHLRQQRGVVVNQVICSTAKRARATAKLLVKGLAYDFDQVLWNETIYSGDVNDLCNLIKKSDDAWQSVMVIGHNPDMTDLVNLLAGDTVENMPTCGVYGMVLEVDSWKMVEAGVGKKLFFDVPKSI